jgi:hypothetical protein
VELGSSSQLTFGGFDQLADLTINQFSATWLCFFVYKWGTAHPISRPARDVENALSLQPLDFGVPYVCTKPTFDDIYIVIDSYHNNI